MILTLREKQNEAFSKRIYQTLLSVPSPFFLLRLFSNFLKSFSICASVLRLGEILFNNHGVGRFYIQVEVFGICPVEAQIGRNNVTQSFGMTIFGRFDCLDF